MNEPYCILTPLKATTGVCEAHLDQTEKPCAIGAKPPNIIVFACMYLVYNTNHKVYKLGEDELNRPPLVALKFL